MQRRSFFGVLTAIGAYLGLNKEVAASSVEPNLPIIQLDGDGHIINADELFRNAMCFCPANRKDGIIASWDELYFVAKVYLPQKTRVYNDTQPPLLNQFYGPVYLSKSGNPPNLRFSLRACAESIFFPNPWRLPRTFIEIDADLCQKEEDVFYGRPVLRVY